MSWLETELREQPEALAHLLEREAGSARTAAQLFQRRDLRYLLIASRGSSSNVARYAQYLLGRAHRVPVMFATPSLYTIYGQPPRLDGALVIGISQSGASPDVVAVLAEAREQGRPTLALTNDLRSPLAQTADAVLPLQAGREQAVAATKTYVNSLGAVGLLFAEMGNDETAREELARMPEALEAQIDLSLRETPPLEEYREAVGMTVVARGVNYGTGFEIALKIRELSGAQFEAFSSADLLHGPIAALKSGRPAIVIAPTGRTLASMSVALEKVRERGAEVIAISDDVKFLAESETALPLVQGVPEWLSPLLTVVPGQVAAVRLATLRDADVDSPVGLTKITLTH